MSDTVGSNEGYVIQSVAARRVLAVGRVVLGFVFLWAFLDKTFGLGYSTQPAKSWLNGGTPAQGFMKGLDPAKPFTGFIQSLGGPVTDFLFQLGMLGLGLALILGIGLRVSAVVGTLILGMMYLAEFPLVVGESASSNPLVDYHIIYIFLLLTVTLTRGGDTWGLGKWWKGLVGKQKWLI